MIDDRPADLAVADRATLRAAIARCRRCGSCAQVCPIFSRTGRETGSPRGRLQVLEAWLDGELEPSRELADLVTLCLACGACTEHCPNEVPSTSLLLACRAALAPVRRGRRRRRFLAGVLARRGRTRRLAGLGRALRPAWARRVPAGRGLHLRWPASRLAREQRLPPLAPVFLDRLWRANPPAPTAETTPAGRAALFPGCVSTYLLPDSALAAARVLTRQGWSVELPAGLGCCGLVQLSSGDRDAARKAVQETLDILDPERYDLVLAPCASCAAMLREYGPALARKLDGESRARAAWLASRVRTVGQWSCSAGECGDVAALAGKRVAYHLPCHLRYALGDSTSGLAALARTEGIEVVMPPGDPMCCGHGGLFSLDHPTDSRALGQAAAKRLLATGAQVIVTECSGCYLQLFDQVSRLAPEVEVRWLGEVL